MAYTKTKWVNNETPLNEGNLNKIEQGVKDAHDDIDQHELEINNIKDTVYNDHSERITLNEDRIAESYSPVNKEVLDKLAEQNGKLLYNGQEIKPTPVQVIDEESTDEEIPSALAVQKMIGGWVEQDAYPVLPENLVLGNGTETLGNPFPIREGSTTSPKIEAVEDFSSPVKDICPFAIKISAPGGDASSNMFYAVDFFDFNNLVVLPSKISWGFWIKNTDVNNIGLTPMNNIDFWLYNHANYSAIIRMRIYDAVNSTLNTSLDLTASTKTINPTLIGTVKKIEENNGWSYLLYELTMSKESWAFNSSSNDAKFYFVFNSAKTALATQQITITNNTIVYDYTIPSGFVRFPQGAILQHPESTIFHPGLIVKMEPKDFFEMDPESELIATEGAVQQLFHPFYGNATLPINEQKGNGTLTPCLFATKNGTKNAPALEQELNASPMSEVLEYQHRLYASVTPEGSSYFLNYTNWGRTLSPPLKQLDSTINRLTFGMWIRDDFLNAIPSSNFQIWLFNSPGGNFATLSFPWKTVYSEVGNENTSLGLLTLGNSAMMTAVPTASTKCLAKQDGWTYIQNDITDIEWVSTFSNFEGITLYFIFNNIRNGFLTTDCRFSNFTFLYNYAEENLNPYAVYPDGAVVDQYPSNVTIPAKVEKSITDIAELKTEIKELKESSPKGKGVVVSISGNTIAFRAREWAEADYDLVHTASIVGGGNGNLFNFGAIGKIPATTQYNQTSYGTLLKSCGDDSCPANFNSTYIGANHAYSIGNSIVATAHGKTEADIGSIWVDTTQSDIEYVLFKIHDINTLWFAPKTAQMMDTGIFSSKALAAGKTLTHQSGATNISDITIEIVNSNAQQLYSTTNKVVHKLLLNGTIEVPLTDGFYESNFVDFVEQYNIIYFPAVLTYLINNAGNNTNTSMNNDSIDDYYCSVSITHRFQKNGACVMFESYDINKEINVGYFGMTQSIAFSTENHYMYVPNTVYDDVILHEPSTSIYLTPDKWRNPELPPTSYFQLYDTNATYTMNTGFCPEYGTARPEIRIEQLGDAAFFYSSFKMYQKLISSGKLYPGDRVEAVVYRILSPKYDEDFTNVNWYWVNDDIYLQVNAHKPIKKILPLPSYMIGKITTIVESNNTTIGNIVTTDGLSINMTGTSNYAILKLSNNSEAGRSDLAIKHIITTLPQNLTVNKVYQIDLSANVTINTLVPSTLTGVFNEWVIIVTPTAESKTITFSQSIRWSQALPTFVVDKIYEIRIISKGNLLLGRWIEY